MKRFFGRASRHVGFQIGAVLLLLFVGTALVSIFWTPHAVDELQMRAKLMPSSAAYPLGTDHLGRDVLSRIMVGAQTSISVGLIAVVIGMSAGVTLGAWAAARGGWVDEALSRTADLIFAFPAVLIAILAEAGLSYLGLGAQPPVPSWGRMLRDAQTYIFQAPELAIWPGLAIALAVLGLNMLGDGLRDLLDPRLRLLRVG